MAINDGTTPAEQVDNDASSGVEGYTTHVDDTDDEDITGGLSPDRTGGAGGYTSGRKA
ncbi:hypothetical protein [Nakamurella flava]|uniref:hypothetical protein n=1 Tax=Nakamurella flava TaxID=2576308 RepID=UPI00140E71F8|nr:hypothetical protein [Nakamurella flava]